MSATAPVDAPVRVLVVGGGSSGQSQRLTHLWAPVGRRVAIMGGTPHGCELGESFGKQHCGVIIVHNGPASQIGDEMGRDDMANLVPWFKRSPRTPTASSLQEVRGNPG